MTDFLETARARIAEAIGGRSGALAFEKATGGRFRRTTVQRWIDGGTWPDISELKAFAEATGRPFEWFFGLEKPEPVILPPPETSLIPVLDVQASAGPGCVADVVRADGEIAFPLYFLKRLLGDRAHSARLESLRARGDSMAPTIANGALIIIDRSQRDLPDPPKNGTKRRVAQKSPIFVFYHGGDLRLKRLQRLDGEHIAVISDNNDEFPVEIIRLGRVDAIKIIGKVIWWDNRL